MECVGDGEAEVGEGVARLGRRGLGRRQELEERHEGAVVRAGGALEPLRRQKDAGDAEAEQHPEVGSRRGRHARGEEGPVRSGRAGRGWRIRGLGFLGGGVFEARAVGKRKTARPGRRRLCVVDG